MYQYYDYTVEDTGPIVCTIEQDSGLWYVIPVYKGREERQDEYMFHDAESAAVFARSYCREPAYTIAVYETFVNQGYL